MREPQGNPEAGVASDVGIVGRSHAIQQLRETIANVARAPRTTVLVTGESGVGKELVARAIHAGSSRRDRPFVAVNCATLSGELLEAELFGYEAGAFTGASARGREGLFAAAQGGILFLDEIGELALELQAKLLRVLQERVYRRVGAAEDRPMDVRILAATNRDLRELVDAGRFRDDLYYRLNVLSIRVPALRERSDDVALLARHFHEQLAAELGVTSPGFEPAVFDRLAAHAWPGNVRELSHCIERALVVARDRPVSAEDLGLPAAKSVRAATAAGYSLAVSDLSLQSVERALIVRALEETAGNRSRAARLLNVNRATLYNKLRCYDISA